MVKIDDLRVMMEKRNFSEVYFPRVSVVRGGLWQSNKNTGFGYFRYQGVSFHSQPRGPIGVGFPSYKGRGTYGPAYRWGGVNFDC